MQNAHWFGWNHKDIIIGVLPFYHSWGSCTCLNSAVYSGARVVILPCFDPEELVVMVEKEKAMPLVFEEIKLDCGYRIDLLVENKLIIELKAVDALNEIHLAQTLTYLKLGNFKLGLLMNFNVPLLKNGIKRIIN